MCCAIGLWLILPPTASAGVNGYEWLSAWSDLPRARTTTAAGLASSYDRAGGDDDYNHYQDPADLQIGDEPVVALQVAGPGILTRFWMPHFTALQAYPIRLVIDGEVRIDTTSMAWLAGQYSYFRSPLVQTLLGGQVSYEPIVFARSLRIETENRSDAALASRHYYQWNYLTLPAGPAAAYTGELTARQRQSRDMVVAMIRHVGANPAGPCPTARTISQEKLTIPGGATDALCRLQGGGTIRSLHLKMPAGTTDAELDGLHLRVSGGAGMGLAIDVPIAHFFGTGHGRARYRSLPLGVDEDGCCYCFWPIPFRQGVSVELRNATGRPIVIESARIEYDPASPPADAGYLHAVCRQERTRSGQQDYTLLDASGSGHYVGNLLWFARSPGGRSLLEGDDIILVNPGKPTERVLHGTGLEDAYNGGFYYNHSPMAELNDPADPPNPPSGTGPYHGLLHIQLPSIAGEGSTRVDQYRWMIGDFVPFVDGIVVKVESFAARPDVLFGSTAFYYAVAKWPGDEPAATGESAGATRPSADE